MASTRTSRPVALRSSVATVSSFSGDREMMRRSSPALPSAFAYALPIPCVWQRASAGKEGGVRRRWYTGSSKDMQRPRHRTQATASTAHKS